MGNISIMEETSRTKKTSRSQVKTTINHEARRTERPYTPGMSNGNKENMDL